MHVKGNVPDKTIRKCAQNNVHRLIPTNNLVTVVKLRLIHSFKSVQGPHDKALNAIAIPPPQRGKHCNNITTDTPAVPPVITTNVLSCVNGSYNPRTAIVT